MGYFDTSTGSHIMSGRSFQLGGFGVKSLRSRAGSWKPSSGKTRRICIPERQGTQFFAAGLIQRPLLEHRLVLGFKAQNFQLKGTFQVLQSEGIAYSESKSSMYSATQFLKALGRTLLILGLGLSLSPPAFAWTAPSSFSEVSTKDLQERTIHGVKFVKQTNGSSQQYDEVNSSREQPTLNVADTSETSEDRLHLSEAFWSGIPTPEGSLLHRLKSQLEMNPSDSRALKALLEAVLEQQDMLRALTIVETLLEVQPENWQWKLLKARTHESLGEFLMAKQDYEELLSLNPLSARFLQGLVMLLNKLGERNQALELIQNSLNQALSEGKDVEARDLGVLLGQFHIQLGNFEDALHHLSTMIEQDPNDYRPYLCQGLAYSLMNQMDKAKDSFAKYLAVCPPDALEHNYFDGLLSKAKASMQIEALRRSAMKSTFRNRKTSKPMKCPSLCGNWNPRKQETFD